MATEDSLMPPNEEEEDNMFFDVLAAPFRGVEGAVQGVYNFLDYTTGDDFLPDYDQRRLGRSTTMAGGVVEGITQFITGFVPVAGALGKAGQVVKARKLFGSDVAKQLLKRGNQIPAKQMAAINKSSKKAAFAKNYAAGVGADFLAFNGQEERLSNFLYQYEMFQNPVTEYLKATGDETEIEGRFKNVLEGMFLEIAATPLLIPFFKSIKLIKNRGKLVAEGMDPEDATEEALSKSDLTQDELFGANEVETSKVKRPGSKVKGDEEAEIEADRIEEEPDAPSGFDGVEQQEFDFKLDADSDKSLGFENTPVRGKQKIDAAAEAKATKLNRSLAQKIAVGGKQALMSNIRLVSSESDLLPLVRSLATNQTLEAIEKGTLKKTTEKDILQESMDLSDALGGNKNSIEAEYKKLKARGDQYADQFNKDQMAIKYLNNTLARKAQDLAIETRGLTKGTDAYDEKFTEMLFHLNLTNASQNLFAQFGRTASLAMLQRKYMYKQIKGKKIDPLPDKLTPQDIAKFRDHRLGSMSDEKLLDLVANAKSGDDIEYGLNKIAKGGLGSNMMDMVQEYWMNALLSGPTTQLVNLIGSAVTYAVGTVERAVGSALSGNFALTRATLQYSFSMQAVADAFKLSAKALKNGEAISIPEAKLFDDRAASRKAISYSPPGGDNAISRTFNFLGEVIRLPSRGLVAGDEFFKAFNYRAYVHQELAAEAIQKGLRGKNLSKYVADRVQGYTTETGRIFNEAGIRRDAELKADEMDLKFEERQSFIEKEVAKASQQPFVLPDGTELSYKDRGALTAKAEQMAKINTHTQDSQNSVSNMLSMLTQKHPTLKFVIPFVRTPTNLLTYGISRSPFGSLQVLSKDFRAKLRSPDASVRAETRGRLATSVTTTAALLYFLQSGKGQGLITGYGPKNKEQRESWEMNNQQYSIKIGDKWVSYNRLDPIATILGVVADINEAQTYNELDDGDLEKVFSVAALAFSNNITSKSYVQGLDNLFDFLKFKDPVRDAEKFLGSIAGGFVPNVINQSLNYEEDRPLREARGIIDRMIKRTPAGGNLPPRRNMLGEVMTVPSSGGVAGVINPLYIKEDPKNVVEYELSNLRSGFRQPSRFLRPGVEELDMKEYYNPETGQQSYDRFLELVGTSTIRGKTLRQRLETMFNSKEYAALPEADLKDETGSDSPRVAAVRRMIRAYRGVAKSKMLKENPELRMREAEAIKKARAARTQ